MGCPSQESTSRLLEGTGEVYSCGWRTLAEFARTGKHKQTFLGHVDVNSVVYSPIHKWKFSGLFMGYNNISRLESVVFSPDGRTLASGSHDGTVLVGGSVVSVAICFIRDLGTMP